MANQRYDIFISFAREDQETAQNLACALERFGFTLWWDIKLRVGAPFDREIERRINEVGAVIVIWSNNSIRSDWVRAEAREASRQNKLFPVRIDDTNLPVEFSALHTLDLTSWRFHNPFFTLVDSLGRSLGLKAGLNNILLNTYPATHPDDLSRAESELWISGTNLRRIFPDHRNALKQVIDRGGRIRALLMSPTSDGREYAAMQEHGADADVNNFTAYIEQAIESLHWLKSRAKDKDQVKVKTIDYPLNFGVDAIDIESPKGIMYVVHYTLASGERDKPILVLRPNDSYWYDFYKRQLEIQWNLKPDEWERLTIDRATELYIPKVSALANKASISNLNGDIHRGFLIPYSEQQYREFLSAEYFYVLHSDTRLLAFLLAQTSEQIGSDDGEVYLHIKAQTAEPFILVRQICVDLEFSGKGYGKILYRHLFKEAAEHSGRLGTVMTFIWKRPANLASERFHTALGWEEVETYELKNGTGLVGIWSRRLT